MNLRLFSYFLVLGLIVLLTSHFLLEDEEPAEKLPTVTNETTDEPTYVAPNGNQAPSTKNLTLQLSPAEIVEDVASEEPVIPNQGSVIEPAEQSETQNAPSVPVGVNIGEDNEPLLNLHLKQKSQAAIKADLQDELDGIPVGKAPED